MVPGVTPSSSCAPGPSMQWISTGSVSLRAACSSDIPSSVIGSSSSALEGQEVGRASATRRGCSCVTGVDPIAFLINNPPGVVILVPMACHRGRSGLGTERPIVASSQGSRRSRACPRPRRSSAGSGIQPVAPGQVLILGPLSIPANDDPANHIDGVLFQRRRGLRNGYCVRVCVVASRAVPSLWAGPASGWPLGEPRRRSAVTRQVPSET